MRLSQDSFSNSCTTQTDTITARNSQRKESTTRDILFPRSLKIKMRKKNAPQRHVERVHNFLIAVKRTENLLLLLISSFPYIEVYIMSLGWFLLELYHEHAPPIEILMEKNKSVGRCDCQLKMWYTIHPTQRHVNTNTQWCVLDLRYYSAIYMKRIRTDGDGLWTLDSIRPSFMIRLWRYCGPFIFFKYHISSSILCCTRHHKFFLAFLFFNFRFGGKLNEETTKHVDDFVGVPTMRFMEFRGFDTARFSPFYIWKITKNWLPRFWICF